MVHAGARQLLGTHLMSDLLDDLNRSPEDIHVFQGDETVGDALAALSDWNVGSAPLVERVIPQQVRQSETNEQALSLFEPKNRVIAIVDGGVLLLHLLHAIDTTGASVKDMFISRTSRQAAESFFSEKLQNIPLVTRDGQFVAETIKNKSIYEVCLESYLNPEKSHTLYSARQVATHRVAVLDEKQRIVNMVSQTDVLRFVLKNIHHVPPELRKTCVDSGSLSSTPACIALGTETVYSVLRRMEDEKVSAVAIVDTYGGPIRANLSISDIRQVGLENFEALGLPVLEFLKSTSKCSYSLAPVTCKTSNTFEDVLNLFNIHKVHRIWVTDEQTRPIAVVTVTDCLKFLCGM